MKLRPEVYPREDYWDALQMMANRMSVSQHKYGALEDNYPHKVKSLESAEIRIHKYLVTGNTEFLLDAANQMVIEFLFPSHGGAHFRATDSDESPGLSVIEADIPENVVLLKDAHGTVVGKLIYEKGFTEEQRQQLDIHFTDTYYDMKKEG